MQAGIITTNIRVKIHFTLPEHSAMKTVTWNCHVNDSAKDTCDMILGRYILTALGINIKLSGHIIESDDAPFKGYTAPMVDMGTYEFKDLNTGKIKTKE